MSKYPSWQYEEIQIGKDYSDPSEVESYDAHHNRFRDIKQENEEIMKRICLETSHVVIDIGTGTGAFALQAAPKCKRVYAVDISTAMLEYARQRAERAGILNIVFRHGGFLSYSHPDQSADAIVTNTAFHHLPDFWKGIALKRLNRMLKTGGRLYLADVIFEDKDIEENIERWISELEKRGGGNIRKDVEAHIRREFSTYDWIIDGLLERAGFRIEGKVLNAGVIGRYLCLKVREEQ